MLTKSQEYFDKFESFKNGEITEQEWQQYVMDNFTKILAELTNPIPPKES